MASAVLVLSACLSPNPPPPPAVPEEAQTPPLLEAAPPPPVEAKAPEPVQPEPIEAVPPAPASFDTASVSAEVKTATFTDVRGLIERLNGIIQRKDYEAWLADLSPEYRKHYSDPEVLAKLSESGVLKRLGIKLATLEDYFLYVVYPSRQNDRVDDIEFIGENDIRAITVNSKGERLILYYLERIDDTWKIGIGR